MIAPVRRLARRWTRFWDSLALRLVGSDKNRARALYFSKKSRQAIRRKQGGDAIFYARAAVASDPDWADGYRVLGSAYQYAGQPDRAREAIQQAAHVAPDDFRSALALGDLEFDLERYAEAETAYRRALHLQPNDDNLLLKLALALRAQARLDEAGALLEQARSIAGTNAAVLLSLGIVRVEQGEFQRAAVMLSVAIKVDPTLARAHYNLGLALAGLKQWQEALKEAQRAVELEPNEPSYQDFYSKLRNAIQHAE